MIWENDKYGDDIILENNMDRISENLDQATVVDIILRILGQKPNRVIARSRSVHQKDLFIKMNHMLIC